MSARSWVAGLISAALASAALGVSRPARACSCGVAGPDSPLTLRGERHGISVSERVELGHGSFDARGTYRRFAGRERWTNLELGLVAALRPFERVELAASGGYQRSSVSTSDTSTTATGVKDSMLTARLELLDQAMSWSEAGSPLALLLTGGVLVPSARLDGAEERGLGAVELSLGAFAERSFGPSTRAGLSVEVAERLPDRSLGFERKLGQRVTPRLTLSHWLIPTLVLSARSSLRWEADVSVEQESKPGTGTRSWQVGAGAAFRAAGSPLRSGVAFLYSPPVSGSSVNTIATSSLELSLALIR